MKLETAIEYLIRKLSTEFIIEIPFNRWNDVKSIIQKAKEMEKQQIMKAYKDYHNLGHIYGLETELYYNENFNLGTEETEQCRIWVGPRQHISIFFHCPTPLIPEGKST